MYLIDHAIIRAQPESVIKHITLLLLADVKRHKALNLRDKRKMNMHERLINVNKRDQITNNYLDLEGKLLNDLSNNGYY